MVNRVRDHSIHKIVLLIVICRNFCVIKFPSKVCNTGVTSEAELKEIKMLLVTVVTLKMEEQLKEPMKNRKTRF